MKKEKTGDNSRPYKLGNKNRYIFRRLTVIFFGYVFVHYFKQIFLNVYWNFIHLFCTFNYLTESNRK